MKITKALREQFMKWMLFNLLTFPVLMIFYIPYQLWWIGLTSLQLVKYVATAGFFAAIVNIIMRPITAAVVRYLDRRYKK
jgi:hypothetical protein